MNSHIKDSGNNYSVFINQGTDYQFDVLTTTFGLPLATNATFSGVIKEHYTSKKSFDLVITKSLDDTKITVSIPSEISVDFKKNRYSFDIIYKLDNKVLPAIQGSIIVNHSLSRL